MAKDMSRYIRQVNGTCMCVDCEVRIVTATVIHPILIKGLESVGTGDFESENVPYCPSCEDEPDFHGEPVYVSLEDLGWA